MRYSLSYPIKLLVYCASAESRYLLSAYAKHPHLSIQFADSETDALTKLSDESIDLFAILDSPEHALMPDTDAYRVFLDLPYPTLLLWHQIALLQGLPLLEAGFSDFFSLEGANQEGFIRCLRMLLQMQHKNQEIQFLRDADPLTRCFNRIAFQRDLNEKLGDIQRRGGVLALVSVDVDHFRHFNQRLGSTLGDQVIRLTCHRIMMNVLDHPVYRLNADEFAIIVVQPNSESMKTELHKLITGMTRSLNTPFHVNGEDHILSTSIGVAVAPHFTRNPDELLNQVNQARQKAKGQHGCTYSVYAPTLRPNPILDNLQESDLWSALKFDQLALHYQPRICLKTGDIVGVEALMRWNHPEHGLIMPDDFIPLSERTGLIVPMGFWALQQVGRDIHTLNAEGLSLGKVGVNLSFRQFQNDYLAKTIQRILSRDQIDTAQIEFELTESSLFSNDEHVKHSIDALSQTGIAFSLDDFGTGYSSFSLLKKLPVNTLKIDRSFITDLPGNSDACEIVKAVIHLAHNLNMAVIAEGVETQEQRDFLIENGCDQAQGFYYSPPVSLPRIISLLDSPVSALL
jgi:diguanylate cyclase (GGDEF)-like protein